MTPTTDNESELCGAGVWLLAASGPERLDEHRSYRTHCQAAGRHPGPHTVRVAGEADDSLADVDPVTLTWPTATKVAATVIPVAGADGTPYVAVWAGCGTNDGRLIELPHTPQPGCRDLYELVKVTPSRADLASGGRPDREVGR